MKEESTHALATRMAELARQIAQPIAVDEVLSSVTSTAREMIPGADAAGVLLITRGGKFESRGTTSALLHQLDELQVLLGEGPCINAAVDDLIVHTDDFASEQRWPRYSHEVQKLGIRSSMSFKLYTSSHNAGALNIFSFTPRVFTPESEATGTVLAAHAAAAILASRRGEALESALVTRDIIGQAKGIIMERFKIDAVAAFDLLRKLSQTTNMRLAEVAVQVVQTR